MLPLRKHVVWVKDTTCGQDLKLELSASVHHQEELDRAVEYNDNIVINLLIWVLIHIKEYATLFFDFSVTSIGELNENFI